MCTGRYIDPSVCGVRNAMPSESSAYLIAREMYVCMCTRTYICTYIRTYARTYIHTYVHTYKYIHTNTYIASVCYTALVA